MVGVYNDAECDGDEPLVPVEIEKQPDEDCHSQVSCRQRGIAWAIGPESW